MVAAVCALLITMSAVGAHPREAEAARPAAAPEVFASNNDSLLVADLDETIRFVCDASRAERGPWRSTTGDRVSRAGAIARRASTPRPSDRASQHSGPSTVVSNTGQVLENGTWEKA